MNSSSDSLPSLSTSSASKVFMRYFRKSARETSPFLALSISTNHCGRGIGGGAEVGVCAQAGGASRHSSRVSLMSLQCTELCRVVKDDAEREAFTLAQARH